MADDDLPVLPNPIPPTPPEPPTPPATETRNVLDINGNVIGQLTLLAGTAESVWTERLGLYSQAIMNIIKNALDTITLNASSSTTTSSGTPSTIGGMTKIPTAGKYIAMFSGSIYTAGASATGEFGIYVNDVLLPETRRDISCNLQLLGGLVTVSLNSIGVGTYTNTEIDLNGGQIIDVKFKSTNGGTIGFKERVFTLIRVQ